MSLDHLWFRGQPQDDRLEPPDDEPAVDYDYYPPELEEQWHEQETANEQ